MEAQGGSGFLALILAVLLAFVFWLWDASAIVGSNSGGAAPNPVRQGSHYHLPSGHSIVIEAVVNRGPLPPRYQAGYEITIDATGHAVTAVTPQGASPGLATPTASPHTIVKEIGVDGLQRLLGQLDHAGFFALRNAHQPLIGGPESAVSVTLADGTWRVRAAELDAADRDRLQHAQALIAAAVGYNPT